MSGPVNLYFKRSPGDPHALFPSDNNQTTVSTDAYHTDLKEKNSQWLQTK